MLYKVFTEKELLKQNKELVELHKRCIKTYLAQQSCRPKIRTKFFKLYDYYINEKNIREYFYTKTELLIRAMVLDRLSEVSTYIYPVKPKKHGRKKKNSN